MVLQKRILRTGLPAFALILLVLGAGVYLCATPRAGEKLSDEHMAKIVGGDGCKDCRYNGQRLDECYHTGLFDACQTNKCIANYMLDDTCDLGDGTCTASLNVNKAWCTQYARVDTNCTTSYPTGWSVWTTSYYGSACTARSPTVRCQKPSNNCDGTLITTSTRYPGIDCP